MLHFFGNYVYSITALVRLLSVWKAVILNYVQGFSTRQKMNS